MLNAFKVEQVDVAEMGRHHVLHRAKHRFDAPWIAFVPVTKHVGNDLALEVGLRAAQVARDNRKTFRLGETLNIFFPAVGQRANHDMFTVIAHQLRRHPFHLPAVEHIQKQSLQDVVAVVAEGDFGCAQLRGGAVKNAAAQT